MATVGMVREALLRAGERSATRGAGGFDIQGLRHGVVAVRWRPPHGEPASDGGLAFLEDYARLLEKIRASDATDGTTSRSIACILSCTLIGPWSKPDASNAARTWIACALTSSLSFDGLDLGRRVRGSSTAAGPSTFARLRNS